MNYQAKQDELDKIKWVASEKKGGDACGDFDYCACCDKSVEYPCAVAAEKSAKPAASKTQSAAKSAAKPAAKTAAGKSAQTKPAAKKSTAAKI